MLLPLFLFSETYGVEIQRLTEMILGGNYGQKGALFKASLC
jgi:hypothetical protein